MLPDIVLCSQRRSKAPVCLVFDLRKTVLSSYMAYNLVRAVVSPKSESFTSAAPVGGSGGGCERSGFAVRMMSVAHVCVSRIV